MGNGESVSGAAGQPGKSAVAWVQACTALIIPTGSQSSTG